MDFPKISIVIPAYNASNYLAEAIDSALAQTYPNVEIIVVNDGSNDEGATERIALSYGDKIRYFHKVNGGSSSALNMGIANMTGEWFSWLSHDDLYVPEKLEKQFEYMRMLNVNKADLFKHIFFSSFEIVDVKGKLIKHHNKKKNIAIEQKLNKIKNNCYLIAEPTLHNFYGCSCLIHRDVFAEVGNFDENLRLINDMDIWYRMYAANYIVHYIPEPLVKCRIHSAQVSKTIGYSYHNPEQDMFWKRSFDWLVKNFPEESKIFFLFGRNAYLKTRNIEGDCAFEQLISLQPSQKSKFLILKQIFKSYAAMHKIAKKIYLKLKT